MNGFSKTCLLLIVLLLAVIAIEPIFAPSHVHAALHKYIAVSAHIDDSGRDKNPIQTFLDKYSADGWDFVAVMSPEGQYPTLFFQK
jgi:hypothetical protein